MEEHDRIVHAHVIQVDENSEDDEDFEHVDNRQFKYDSAKSWYMFGRGAVDTQGRNGCPQWVPDNAVTQCSNCRILFDFFNRRHHCRFCGKIFCAKCSSLFAMLPENFQVREPQRVCETCYQSLEGSQEELAATISNSTRRIEFDPNAPQKYVSTPVSFSMTAEITKACRSIENFFGHCPNADIQDQFIPAKLLRQAKGLAFVTIAKVGIMFSARAGSGIVISKCADGNWSAPTAIGLGGVGWGFQLGGEIADFVIILNTASAVDAFSGKTQVSLGSQLAVAMGPLGRTGEASMNLSDGGGVAPCYTYSQSQGLFVGISLEGAIINERGDVNLNFYGIQYDPKDILAGKYPQPRAAKPLYRSLRRALNRDPESFSRD